MTERTPDGFPAQGAGTVLGCATVRTASDGRELWHFAALEQSPTLRLARLGRRGVFGFIEAGHDADGLCCCAPRVGELA